MEDTKGRQCVLVTAGAAGLGLEIARAFVRAGDAVAVCDVDEGGVEALRGRGVAPDGVLREMLAGMSIKRLVPPHQVAAMGAFLAAAGNDTVTGQVISIDGDAQMMA